MINPPFFTMDDFDFTNKTILLRVDFNSPVDPKTNAILDDSRFKAHLPTIQELFKSKVIVLSHQSRPGKKDFTNLKIHADLLSSLLRKRVKFVPGLFEEPALKEIENSRPGEILMLDNTRFYSEEIVLSDEPPEVLSSTHIVRELSKVSDYFINDAFATAHRPNVTVTGFALTIPNIAGRLMEKEVMGVEKFFSIKDSPKVGIFGGAKADDSIKIIDRMLSENRLNYVLTGGLVGHLFIVASGFDMGEKNMNVLKKEVPNLDDILKKVGNLISKYGDIIKYPTDFIGNDNGKPVYYTMENFRKDIPAMDIGINTIAEYSSIIKNAKGIVLNGPMGVFELEDYSAGTREVFNSVARSSAYKVGGGGHTNAAMEKFNLAHYIDHLSTGGGALISYLAGELMPGIESLKLSKAKFGGDKA